MPSNKLLFKTFRITEFHRLMLESEPYKSHKGKLIRILLDEFFNGRLLGARMKFDAAVMLEKLKKGRK